MSTTVDVSHWRWRRHSKEAVLSGLFGMKTWQECVFSDLWRRSCRSVGMLCLCSKSSTLHDRSAQCEYHYLRLVNLKRDLLDFGGSEISIRTDRVEKKAHFAQTRFKYITTLVSINCTSQCWYASIAPLLTGKHQLHRFLLVSVKCAYYDGNRKSHPE